MRIRQLLAATLLAVLCSNAEAGAVDLNGTRLVVSLRDGSRVVGKAMLGAFPVQARYGSLNISLPLVSLLTMQPDRESAVLQMVNGDKMTGTLLASELLLETGLGHLKIGMENVTSIEIWPSVRQGANEYLLVKQGATWTGARDQAEALGGHLVAIGTEDENDTVQQLCRLAGESAEIWIGRTDTAVEGEWLWVTGEMTEYTNWYSRQPDNYGNGEECAHFNPASGKWGDQPEAAKLHFVVEFEK